MGMRCVSTALVILFRETEDPVGFIFSAHLCYGCELPKVKQCPVVAFAFLKNTDGVHLFHKNNAGSLRCWCRQSNQFQPLSDILQSPSAYQKSACLCLDADQAIRTDITPPRETLASVIALLMRPRWPLDSEIFAHGLSATHAARAATLSDSMQAVCNTSVKPVPVLPPVPPQPFWPSMFLSQQQPALPPPSPMAEFSQPLLPQMMEMPFDAFFGSTEHDMSTFPILDDTLDLTSILQTTRPWREMWDPIHSRSVARHRSVSLGGAPPNACSMGEFCCMPESDARLVAFTCYDGHTICLYCMETSIVAYTEALGELGTRLAVPCETIPPALCPATNCCQQLSPHFFFQVLAQPGITQTATQRKMFDTVATMARQRDDFAARFVD